MPSIPHEARQANLTGPKTVGPAETALAMFSLLSMIGAFVYISYTTLRTLRSPLLRSLRVKVKMDPAGTEKEVDDAFAEEEEEEEMEKEHAMFDAGLDAMIEEAARQKIYAYGNIHTLSSLDAELPDIGEVLRKRNGNHTNSTAAREAKKRHREMLKNQQELYEFDEENMDGPFWR